MLSGPDVGSVLWFNIADLSDHWAKILAHFVLYVPVTNNDALNNWVLANNEKSDMPVYDSLNFCMMLRP